MMARSCGAEDAFAMTTGRATSDTIVATAAADIVIHPTWSEAMVIVSDATAAPRAPGAAQGLVSRRGRRQYSPNACAICAPVGLRRLCRDAAPGAGRKGRRSRRGRTTCGLRGNGTPSLLPICRANWTRRAAFLGLADQLPSTETEADEARSARQRRWHSPASDIHASRQSPPPGPRPAAAQTRPEDQARHSRLSPGSSTGAQGSLAPYARSLP